MDPGDRKQRAILYATQVSCRPHAPWVRSPYTCREMTRQTEELLEAFDQLPEEERRIFAQEVLRRVLPFESGPLTEAEIGAASDALFKALDAVTLSPEQEQLLDQRWNDYLQDPSQGVPWETVQPRRRRGAP